MSEFNFKSSICTSREQSERLLSLGLKKETADMHWEDDAYFDDYEDWNAYVGSPKHSKHIPAWSMHRLLELNLLCCEPHFAFQFHITNVNDAYEYLVSHIEWLIKEGYFNKEYLV